jgi:hypothetical protein
MHAEETIHSSFSRIMVQNIEEGLTCDATLTHTGLDLTIWYELTIVPLNVAACPSLIYVVVLLPGYVLLAAYDCILLRMLYLPFVPYYRRLYLYIFTIVIVFSITLLIF